MSLLELRGIGRSFGGVRALDDVSLDVDEGSIVGLIGPNGAGKTTLFNVVTGLQPAEGSVVFDGHEIAHLPPHRRALLGIARSFQNLGLMMDETAETNALAALHRSAGYSGADVVLRPWRRAAAERTLRDRARVALDRFGLLDDSDHVVADLSFARARLVEIAAVVAEEPRLMLLDEPTTGLDVAEVDRLGEILLQLRDEGTTILIVAHDVSFVMRVCDHVYVLAEGRPLFDGPPEEVQAHPEVAEAYLGRSA
jgi:ABC-type branched-subunit amino acid transport system ATPase component